MKIADIIIITLLALVNLLFLTSKLNWKKLFASVGFTSSIICYVLIESDIIEFDSIFGFLLIVGAVSVPFFFWLLTKIIFDDHFEYSWKIVILFGVQQLTHIQVYFHFSNQVEQIIRIFSQVSSLGFVMVGIIVAFQTRATDLIDKRLQFRKVFILTTSIVIGLTVIFEIANLDESITIVLQWAQRLSIIAITLYFLFNTVSFTKNFFFYEGSKEKKIEPSDGFDPRILENLNQLIKESKIYRREGLTIRKLADLMEEQEYKLRRVINGDLGFRNFNDFLNKFRVQEACEILKDPQFSKKTILEIAYELGYQSIGPFNRAFKQEVGITPTEYRKSNV